MEENHHHHFLLKLARLFPSSLSTSCRLKTLPDVAETLSNPTQISHESDLINSPLVFKKSSKQALLFPPPKREQKQNQSSSSNSGCWFTNTDADTDTFFSLSSNSGESFPASRRKNPEFEPGSDHISTEIYYSNHGGYRRRHRRRKMKRELVEWVMEDSYAVEKRSSDPYGDFRASMVEMIVEKQIFGEEDLERMLICYLGLNVGCYHGIIVDVFSEICRTLFCNI